MKLLPRYSIAIVGGGMVGASLALLLAQQKPEWQIALLESHSFSGDLVSESHSKHSQPSFDARSTAISQGSADILQALDLWNSLAAQATPIKEIHVSDAGHFLGGRIDAATYGLDAVGYVVPNASIGRALVQQLKNFPNVHYVAPVKVENLLPQQHGYRINFSDLNDQAQKNDHKKLSVDCDLAVLADGSQSQLRDALGIQKIEKKYFQTAIIANVAYSEAHHSVAYERFTELGPLALLPLGQSSKANESALVLTLPTDQAEEIIRVSDEEFLQHLQKRFGFRLGKFLRVGRRHAYPLSLIQSAEQVRSHLVLMGNAAHFLHPVAGQGFNLSLRDCTSLVDALLRGEQQGKILGELSVLQEYLKQQETDQQFTVGFSDQLVRLFSTQSIPLMALRHLGFVGLDLMPSVKKQFVAQTMGRATQKYI